MSETEYLDIFDDNMKKVGTATREEVHSKGHWHQTFHCWVIRRENGRAYVLFQRRGPDKKVYPNTLDITAAGHLLAGEAPEDGIRELAEELGIPTKFETLVPLGIRTDVAIIGPVTNREFCHTYFLENDAPLDSYRLQPDEVSGLVQMEIGDGLKLFGGALRSVPVSGYQVDREGARRSIEFSVSVKDIIPRLDRYYLKIFIMAERFFEGEVYLGI
jgi:isopentenyldiphosphate isomerase